MFISLGCASVVFYIGGLDRTPWRYSSAADHFQITILTVLAIVLGLVLTFAVNRLEGIARSLPVLQGGLIISALVFVRGAARCWYVRQASNSDNDPQNGYSHETVLVVGVNRLSELFLVSLQEFASQQVRVAGVLTEEPRMRGRAIQQKPILGTVEDLQEVLQSLEVHGVTVDKIVVAAPRDRLTPRALETLLDVAKASEIVVHFLSERLGFEHSFHERASAFSGRERNSFHGQRALALISIVDDADRPNLTAKSFWLVKRVVDIFGAAFLMVTLAPVGLLVGLIVALDVGFPVLFWQQRPGLNGRPFKLYKFRTMGAPYDRDLQRVPDEQRSSAVGGILRRFRLDELPQLYNVLVGDMSFVGPRPLLPRDQSPEYANRLSVRPGITGWAQVNGGRIISLSEKCVLDIWYVQNASFALDLRIVLRTVGMVLFGDRANVEAVHQARYELGPSLNAVPVAESVPGTF